MQGFNQEQFIRILLPLLYQRGIETINIDELGKQLYYYEKIPKFKKLCVGIQSEKNIHDLVRSINREKQFGHVYSFVNDNKKIGLDYEGMRLHHLIRNMDALSVNLLMQMADQLSIIHQIESKNNENFHLYFTDPNQEYYLVNGKTYVDSFSGELITDGEIHSVVPLEYFKNSLCQSATSNNKMLIFQESQAKRVVLKDSMYAVMQEKCNHQIKQIEVFTQIMDYPHLSQISEIANQDYSTSSETLSSEPYIRKVKLR